MKWSSGEVSQEQPLDAPVDRSADAYPRARYLSQQFVEELCSIEGMPTLIAEIERVIFEAHPSLERDGAVDFGELLELRAGGHRDARAREQAALANVSDQIGVEMEKTREVKPLEAKIAAKEKLIARYEKDRKGLLPKDAKKTGERLQELIAAAERVRGHLRIARQSKGVHRRGQERDQGPETEPGARGAAGHEGELQEPCPPMRPSGGGFSLNTRVTSTGS